MFSGYYYYSILKVSTSCLVVGLSALIEGLLHSLPFLDICLFTISVLSAAAAVIQL